MTPQASRAASSTGCEARVAIRAVSRANRRARSPLAALLILLAGQALAGGAIQDVIFGDGFDVTICDAGLPSNSAEPKDYARALELCREATEGGHEWGLISATLTLADGSGVSAPPSHAIRPTFGTNNVPHNGVAMAVLSTGAAAAPGDTNPPHVAVVPGLDNGTSSPAPSDWLAANGGVLPHAPGCEPLLASDPFDPVMLTLRIRTPGNARSFSFDADFFAADYPEWVCGGVNDVFVALLDSSYAGTPANPADKNLAVYAAPNNDRYPLGVNLARDATGLFTQCMNGTMGCESGIAQQMASCTSTAGLIGTGLDVPESFECDIDSLRGGGTDWLTVRGNVIPGEIITLRLAIWDTADPAYDSLILLDDFRWSGAHVTPGVSR